MRSLLPTPAAGLARPATSRSALPACDNAPDAAVAIDHDVRRVVLFGALALLAFAGCAATRIEAPPLDAAESAHQFDRRSLSDAPLHRFLQANLGHDVDAWDFDALCWAGFYFHPSLELARAQWSTAQAAALTAGSRPNPSLTLSPGYNFTREAGVSPWMPAVNFDFLLETGGKRSHRLEMARFEAEAAKVAVFGAAWQLRSELRKALENLAAATRQSEVLRRQTDRQRIVATLLQQRFEAGAMASVEATAARRALLRAEAAELEATTQIASARARVAAALGLPLSALDGMALPAPPLPPGIAPEALSTLRLQSLCSRPDILGALARYHSARSALALELAKRTPDVHLGPAYQYDQGQNKWSLGITFELPVFNHNEGPIAEAEGRCKEAAAQFNAVQAQVIADIDAASAALTGASAQRDRAQRLRALAQQQVAQARERTRLGAADALDVATAELDEATIESSAVDAENAYAHAAGQLEDALRTPFTHLSNLTEPVGKPGSP